MKMFVGVSLIKSGGVEGVCLAALGSHHVEKSASEFSGRPLVIRGRWNEHLPNNCTVFFL